MLADYLPESRTVYRGFVVSIGIMSRIQEMMGVGDPTAVQWRTAMWPISTTFVVGAWVIIGKPVGRWSAVMIKNDGLVILFLIIIMRYDGAWKSTKV